MKLVAIDGPAAAGKGTLARRLAVALDVPHLDTGLLYRAVGRIVLDAGADPTDPDAAITAARSLAPADLARPDLRGPDADAAAGAVAAIAQVRAALLDFQRGFGARGAVLDGRDIGTVIAPEADAKLFVKATPTIRARRRHAELRERGGQVSMDKVLADIRARDQRDSMRSSAPLVAANDAALLDTSFLSIEAAVKRAIELVDRQVKLKAERAQ